MISAFEQYFTSLKGKKIAVLGLGVSNRPLVRLLLEFGCDVVGCDRTPREKLEDEVLELEQLGCALRVGDNYLDGVEADVLFRTPGMHPGNPAIQTLVAKGARVTSEMEVFFEVCSCPVIAVTGSDGKTTTTSVIAEMLRAAGRTVWLGGNIGTPLLDQADQMRPDHVAVLELSSFQLMSMKKAPAVAVITNLSPNHLDWHRDFEEYVEAKRNLFKQQGREDVLVLNYDNLPSRELAEKAPGQVRFFSRESFALPGGVWLKNGELLDNGEAIMEVGDIRIPGMHNVENYMAACAALRGIVPHAVMKQVARAFNGVEHRLELVRELDGVKYYNDSIASSPSRTLAGIRCFPADKIILIAGGYDKHIPFDELGAALPCGVRTVLLCGATADKIEAAIKAAPDYREGRPELARFDDLDDTVAYARKIARPGDLVLLSPACASFDQFPNFAARGRYFKELVHKL